MYVITGAAGFIGSALLGKLNAEGIDDVVAVDDFAHRESWRNLLGKRVADLVDKDVFLESLTDPAYARGLRCIVHMGACSSTTETDVAYLLRNNYGYTKRLAAFAADRGVRFIYASSAAVYGDGSLGFSDDPEMTRKYRPLNPYGLSKQLFDAWAIGNGMTSKACGLRFFNVFGPNEYHKGTMASMVCHAYRQIRQEGGEVRLYKSHREGFADGEQSRDFVYVKDCVDVIYWLIRNKSLNGIFNLGSGVSRTWNDLITGVFAAMKLPPRVRYIEMPAELRRQYQYFTLSDNSQLVRAGCPVVPKRLEEAVADYVVNHLDGAEAYI